MVVPFRRSLGAFIFAPAAMLASAQPATTAAEDRGAIPLQALNGCIVGYRFEPGPIVGGHSPPTHSSRISSADARVVGIGAKRCLPLLWIAGRQ
jgi:hypothetical protein